MRSKLSKRGTSSLIHLGKLLFKILRSRKALSVLVFGSGFGKLVFKEKGAQPWVEFMAVS